MIFLTKLNREPFALNDELIETIQENPDTTIRLTTGNMYIVRESAQEVVDLLVRFRQSTLQRLPEIVPASGEADA